jgi:DNA-binding transcriptional LysR family regulator
MSAEIEFRHLVAAVTLAEEMNFTRAAKRLRLSQPAISRRLAELENRSRLRLVNRDHANFAMTDAGRAFVEEAKLSLVHYQRALQYAKAATEGIESHLSIGHSPYLDPVIISTLLAIHLPLHPKLQLHLQSDFAPDLVHSLLTSTLDLALIANPAPNLKLTMTKVTEAPFYIAIREEDSVDLKTVLTLDDIRDMPWILFDRKVHPLLYDAILRRAAEEGIMVTNHQSIMSAGEGIQLVAENMGVAFLSRSGALRNVRPSVNVRPLADKELRIELCLATRSDNRNKLASEFVRAFMKRSAQVLRPPQMTLPMSG